MGVKNEKDWSRSDLYHCGWRSNTEEISPGIVVHACSFPLGRYRLENQEFEVILCYILSLTRPAWATEKKEKQINGTNILDNVEVWEVGTFVSYLGRKSSLLSKDSRQRWEVNPGPWHDRAWKAEVALASATEWTGCRHKIGWITLFPGQTCWRVEAPEINKTHTSNPSTREAETGGSLSSRTARIVTLSWKTNKGS